MLYSTSVILPFSPFFLAAGFGWSGIGFTFISSTGRRAIGLGEGRAGRNDPLFRRHGAGVSSPCLDAAGVDVLFRFASRDDRPSRQLPVRPPGSCACSFGLGVPTTTSLASGSCCSFSATSSSSALQVLSTRHGFLTFGYSHSFTLVACGGGGGGGGGFSTVTDARSRSRQATRVGTSCADTDVPDAAPVVLSVAVFPLPEILPPLAVHPPTVTGTLSGLVQEQVIVAVPPA